MKTRLILKFEVEASIIEVFETENKKGVDVLHRFLKPSGIGFFLHSSLRTESYHCFNDYWDITTQNINWLYNKPLFVADEVKEIIAASLMVQMMTQTALSDSYFHEWREFVN